MRRKLQGSEDGNRQMVKVLSAVLTDGLAAVEAACAAARADGIHSADVVLNILSRQRDPGPVEHFCPVAVQGLERLDPAYVEGREFREKGPSRFALPVLLS
jgi:hypothetical protein